MQEALVNAAKHAPGQPIAVRLDYGEDDVRLTVVNRLDATRAPVRDEPADPAGDRAAPAATG